ncbi:sorting nexin-24 isoform X1 [Andrena cerasifolii]|uniref:sorting nexin-24 isoform X1 n=1 Tax=Andrena cerasifolii TaxID=2819439 RepID=UPI004037B19B
MKPAMQLVFSSLLKRTRIARNCCRSQLKLISSIISVRRVSTSTYQLAVMFQFGLKKGNTDIAPFPPKRVRNSQPKVLEQRRAALELYVQKMLRLSATKQQVLNFLGIEGRAASVSYKSAYKEAEEPQHAHPSALGHHPVLTFHCDPYAESSTTSSLPDIVINGVLLGIYKS